MRLDEHLSEMVCLELRLPQGFDEMFLLSPSNVIIYHLMHFQTIPFFLGFNSKCVPCCFFFKLKKK